MNRIVRVLGSIMGLVGLVGMVMALVLMFKGVREARTHPGLRGTPQPVKSPVATVLPLAVSPTVEEPTFTPTPKLGWETATLEDIHFGEPQVVLSDTLGLQIVRWISEEEVLILRDIKPGGKGSAIEVFNVKSGTVKRLAEGRFSGMPIWNPVRRAVVYLRYDEARKQRDLIWQPLDAQKGQKLASDVVLPIVLMEGGEGAGAYSVKAGALVGKSVIPGAQERRLSFAQYAMRIPTPYEWIYRTAISPDGEWQVVYNCEHFLLMSSKDGMIKELDLGKARGWERPRWALRAEWSPDGQKLAVVATVGRLPNQVRFLLLLNPWTGNLREIPISRPFVIYEVNWSPFSRFLLLSGAIEYTEEGFAVIEHRLLDVSTGQERKMSLLPDVLRGASFAWSPDGRVILINCTKPGQGALCSLPVEVQR